jgi:DNA-directed RNA polymerase subunit alpha
MLNLNIILPSKPKVVSETDTKGTYEIDGLYPGYGHTLGNSLRRIIMSSMPGVAVTYVKIDGVSHEFSTIEGVKEDVITILLNLQRVRFRMNSDEPQKVHLDMSGIHDVKAGDMTAPGQVEIIDKDQHIAHLTDKSSKLVMELTISKGMGYVPKEVIQKEKVEIGAIALDAAFTPVRRANYEVENMRVGDRTDYNRLRVFIETDGVVTPHETLERSIDIMIDQLKAIRGFRSEEEMEIRAEDTTKEDKAEAENVAKEAREELNEDTLKKKVEELSLSARTVNALSEAGIRTVGGLARKKEVDLLEVDGLGEKGIKEIRRALSNFGITLK